MQAGQAGLLTDIPLNRTCSENTAWHRAGQELVTERSSAPVMTRGPDQATSSTPSCCLWDRRRHTTTAAEGKGYVGTACSTNWEQDYIYPRAGLQGCEMLRIPHCLHSRLTDGGKVVSPTRRLRSTPQKHYSSASGAHFCSGLSEPQSLVRPEGLGKLKKINSSHRVWDPQPSGL
jgi:hypothetical protein